MCFGYVCVMIEECDQVIFEQSIDQTGVRRQVLYARWYKRNQEAED